MPLDPHLPVALARLHRSTPAGAVVELDLPGVDQDGPAAGHLIVGAGFEPGPRPGQARRLRTLPDWVGPGMRVLVCGLNPSLTAADAGYGFAGSSNRFWPAALAAGLVPVARDPEAALASGVGFTDLVKRATPAAAALSAGEYRAGLVRVAWLAEWLRPDCAAFVGLAGWRAAVDRSAVAGWQPGGLPGTSVYVMPSTSGLNARTPLAALADHLRIARRRPGRAGSR